ncbi:hypothetical protein LCGC14_0993060 [marine sediment metagenome]|uniref:Uncharacterized protein n=1 Tax=marine sediment metagenome TaxID=412755 RepID=A0A0F9RBR5_9ZZZZ
MAKARQISVWVNAGVETLTETNRRWRRAQTGKATCKELMRAIRAIRPIVEEAQP